MNRVFEHKARHTTVLVLLAFAFVFAVTNAMTRHVAIRHSEEIRQCQNHCIEIWIDGSAVELAGCFMECNQ